MSPTLIKDLQMKNNFTATDKKGSVMITGGSGVVGSYLTSMLLEKGYSVSHLSRRANLFGKVRVYRWNPEEIVLEPQALENIDYIIHLAGANIGEKRWSNQRRKEISSSRVGSANLLHSTVKKYNIQIKAFISASATGYYGTATTDCVFNEENNGADDFTGNVCRQWEEAADKFEESGIRTVKIRSALVLEKDSAILNNLLPLVRYGIFPVMGNGRQYLPWIHITDICRIYLMSVEDARMRGPYNAAAPEHISFREFVEFLALLSGKKGFFLPVPQFLLKARFGKMSDIILKGSRISSEKIISAGFEFSYPRIEDALKNILSGM